MYAPGPPEGEAPGWVFESLKATCVEDWRAYVAHDFVRGLADGSLPEACFRHYLAQDYRFLVHFSRAYALAVFKSDDPVEMRQAATTLKALLDEEMALHVDHCRRWGLDEAALLAVPEAPANVAYTRYVLETGLAGDLLDLLVALAPCVVGYGEIGAGLLAAAGPEALADNPYREWIETYGGAEYQEVARDALAQLDRVAARRLGSDLTAAPRWPGLSQTFRTATRLEIGFWDMGLMPPD